MTPDLKSSQTNINISFLCINILVYCRRIKEKIAIFNKTTSRYKTHNEYHYVIVCFFLRFSSQLSINMNAIQVALINGRTKNQTQ